MRKTLLGTLLALLGSLMAVVPALAYTATAPGGSATANAASAPPGGTVQSSYTFYNPSTGAPLAGTTVNFFAVAPAGCTPQLAATTGVTGADGKAAINATFPSNCSGSSVQICAVAPSNGATVCSTIQVNGYPNTNASTHASGASWPLPAGLIALALAALAGLAVYGARRRVNLSGMAS